MDFVRVILDKLSLTVVLLDKLFHPSLVAINYCFSNIPSEGSSVQFEGAGDQKQPSLQLLQDHDSLPLVDTGQEDGHGAGGQGGADSPLVLQHIIVDYIVSQNFPYIYH